MKKRYYVFPLTFLIFMIFDCILAIIDELFYPLFPTLICNTIYYHYFIRGGYFFFIAMTIVYVFLEYKHIKLKEALIYLLSFLGILLLHIPFYVLALTNTSFPWYAIIRIMYENDLLVLFMLFAIGAFVYISKLISKDQPLSTYDGTHTSSKIHIRYFLFPLIYLVFNAFVYIYSTYNKMQIQTSLFDAVFYNYILIGIHMVFIGALITYIIFRY